MEGLYASDLMLCEVLGIVMLGIYAVPLPKDLKAFPNLSLLGVGFNSYFVN